MRAWISSRILIAVAFLLCRTVALFVWKGLVFERSVEVLSCWTMIQGEISFRARRLMRGQAPRSRFANRILRGSSNCDFDPAKTYGP